MATKRDILILGASYGALLAAKLLRCGHDVTLVCRSERAGLINRDGIRVRLPVRSLSAPVEMNSRRLPGRLTARLPGEVDAPAFDMAVLAMQEPHYAAPDVRRVMQTLAAAKVPCLSLMNMPPLPYLRRLPGLDAGRLRPAFTDASVWDGFEPGLVTLCSPDPQAFRPPEEPLNVLQVSLPTNFKAARFADDRHTAMLAALQDEIEAIRHPAPGGPVELPVKLKVHDSLFVPLAKWAMLMTGNYRCVTPGGARSIRDAVLGDPRQSEAIYDWVNGLCEHLGAAPEDLVPFGKYARAAEGLVRPSSAARALYAGATQIERVDRLVALVAETVGAANAGVAESVSLVDSLLAANRRAAA